MRRGLFLLLGEDPLAFFGSLNSSERHDKGKIFAEPVMSNERCRFVIAERKIQDIELKDHQQLHAADETQMLKIIDRAASSRRSQNDGEDVEPIRQTPMVPYAPAVQNPITLQSLSTQTTIIL
ncbi:hypothetical protein H6P81_014749 [Aristolochia fimbriata]|uniref:Uncharacterized protein n=1 Tax=Aristolochia fimbriata TaxID=158543 RepID=A0AAV7E5C5_ARIFI|nr:hypothetical protein H6P81_014749 [Aristolochia fimbriata]